MPPFADFMSSLVQYELHYPDESIDSRDSRSQLGLATPCGRYFERNVSHRGESIDECATAHRTARVAAASPPLICARLITEKLVATRRFQWHAGRWMLWKTPRSAFRKYRRDRQPGRTSTSSRSVCSRPFPGEALRSRSNADADTGVSRLTHPCLFPRGVHDFGACGLPACCWFNRLQEELGIRLDYRTSSRR